MMVFKKQIDQLIEELREKSDSESQYEDDKESYKRRKSTLTG